MKYAYIIVAIVLVLIVGYFAYATVQNNAQEAMQEEVPEGYHKMSDGTLMRNDAGTEGMGALSELQEKAQIQAQKEVSLEIDPNAEVFEVRGVNYGFDVKEIRVKKGQTVTINFESTDGFHDWAVDEFDAKTQKVQPGTPTSVTFVADQAGTFEYYCSVGQHRAHGMVGKLIVEE